MMMGASSRYSGVVKSFRDQWGFLTAEGVEGDVFLHLGDSPALAGTPLRLGETLEFDLSTGGPNNQARAINATRVQTEAGVGGGGATLSGTVKSFKQGWGLLESPSLEGALYFGDRDNPHLKDGVVMPGDEVTFEIGTNPMDGRSKAINVTLSVKDQSQCIGQRFRGSVKSFADGWGFAISPRFTGTILLGSKQVSAANVALQTGDIVEFEVAVAPNGKFEATNIQKAMPGMVDLSSVAGASARDRSRSPFVTPSLQAAVQAEGRFVGTVKKMFVDGWGFIVCDQISGDVFVNMRDSPALVQPLQQGEMVSFDLVQRAASDKNNGAAATNVQLLSSNPVVQTMPVVPQQVQVAAAASVMGAVPLAGVQSQHVGTVVQLKPEGWGWLEAATCNGQVFFGLRDNPQLTAVPNVGDQLVFELAAGPKGRSKAINVSPAPPEAINVQPSLAGQRVQGVIKNLNDGWGFATADGIPGRVMVGKKALMASGLDASMLQVGEAIEFEVSMALKGYEAVNIRKLSFAG
mmetsp:Transcript_34843/g.80825  ORF Transcript_34843/g.80825 Transcript_34843/m.80825 type:complete len:520 (-) Transcript_34843:350-1909(-)